MNNKEAIEYLKEVQSHIDLENGCYTQEMYDAIDMAIGKLQANDEQVIGEWEDYSVDFYRCPECGYLLGKDCPCCQNKVILPRGGR